MLTTSVQEPAEDDGSSHSGMACPDGGFSPKKQASHSTKFGANGSNGRKIFTGPPVTIVLLCACAMLLLAVLCCGGGATNEAEYFIIYSKTHHSMRRRGGTTAGLF